MRRRSGVVLLCLCAVGALLSFSSAAPGAADQAQIAVIGGFGDCSGFLLETLAGQVTGCRAVPSADLGGVWSVAADGSLVGNGQNGPGSAAPVTLVRPDGQVVVLDSNPYDFNPSLSPDGSKVVFARLVPEKDQGGVWPSNLFVVNADGSGLKQVASGGGSQLDVPTFSPDGNTIAYKCQPVWGTGTLVSGAACGPLPDGSTREYAVMLMNADGSDKRVIVLDQGTTQTLSWSADGKWIATESVAPCTCSGGYTTDSQVFVYHTDGSDLFSGGDPSQYLNPDPSRQVTHETDGWGVFMAQFVGGSSSQLVYSKPFDDSGAQGNYDYMYMINVDGTGRHELSGSLSPEGEQDGLIIPAATGGGPPPFVNVMRVPVPSVHALSYRSAKQRLQAAHLRVGKIRRSYSARTPRNHVLGQYPHGGGYAHRTTRQGPSVTLTLSRGPRK